MDDIIKNKIAQRVDHNSESYYFSDQQLGLDNRTKKLVMEQTLRYVKGPNVLELGFVDGMFTDMMLEHGLNVTVVEGAKNHIEYAIKKYKREKYITIVHDYFETFDSEDRFDTIVAGDMIQYLDNPIPFFIKAKNWLTVDGAIIVTTPNRRSFHRRIGAYLGISINPEAVTSLEKSTGNIIMYDQYLLRDVLVSSGLFVHFVRGCFLKPLSSKQMETWDDNLLKAFLEIGDELGDYCWFLVALCTRE